MKTDSMELGGYVLEGVALRAKVPRDLAPGHSLIDLHGALLDGFSGSQPAQTLSLEDLTGLWQPWTQPGLDGPVHQLAIVEASSDAFLGSLVVRVLAGGRLADLGYWVDPGAWGRGIGGRAVRLAQWWAFECLGVDGLSASVQPDNTRSLALLKSLGFECLGPIPGAGPGLLAHNLPRHRWPDRDGGWSPEPRGAL